MPALTASQEMSGATWEALKKHIMKERRRKKEEQEADAEEERLRRERENKQKQDIMTLDETKETLVQLEVKLGELKDEKHQLFLQLKKVLNEDDTRRRAMIKETNELLGIASNYQQTHIAMGGAHHPHMFMHGDSHARNSALYKVGIVPNASSGMHGSLKRPRSPSPPPSSMYSHSGYKSHNLSPYPSKHGPYSSTQSNSYFSQTPTQPTYHPHLQRVQQTHVVAKPSHESSSGLSYHTASVSQSHQSSHLAGATGVSYSQFRSFPSVGSGQTPHPSAAAPDAKHLHPAYHLQSLPQSAFAAGLLQQQLEQANQKPAFSDERLYLPPSGSVVTSSGFPVRVVHSSTSQFPSKASNNPPIAHGASSSQRHLPASSTSRFY